MENTYAEGHDRIRLDNAIISLIVLEKSLDFGVPDGASRGADRFSCLRAPVLHVLSALDVLPPGHS